MEITEKMLDAIEAVKGRRDPAYWDGRCKRYMEKQENNENLTKDELELKAVSYTHLTLPTNREV